MQQTLNTRTLKFLLISIGLITLPHVFHVPLPIISFFFVLLIWRFISIWQPKYLPNQAWVFLLLLSGIALLIIMHQGVFGRDAGTAVFVTALGLKLLEIKNQRDLYLITYLAFIVAASQFLYLQNVLMGGYILLVCISLLGTLIAINSGSMNHYAAIKTAGKILLQAMPLMIILFIFFPRLESPRWSFLNDTNKALTGLSDTLEPGAISRLGMSGELVFRAKFSGKIPKQTERYWRGPVFSYTDGKQWKPSNNHYFQRHLDKVKFSGTAYQYQLLMEPQNKNWVFALEMPARYQSPLYENGVHQLLTSEPPNKRAEYKITSYAHYNTGYITKTERRENRQIPRPPAQRIEKLIKQLNGFNSSPEDFIKNIFRYFRDKQFYYTLMPPLMQEKPIETFLFDTKAGFCGHYATAFVYLMRVAGIPARVVSGYQGGTYNETGKFIEVRQANAHAWAEVWLQGKGWVRYDPTTAIAPERIEQDVNIEQQLANNTVSFAPIQLDSQTISWMRQARSLWSSVDYSWQRWIINYDRKNQLNFLAGLGIKTLKTMLYWLMALLALVTSVLAITVFRKPKQKRDKAQQYYQKACQKIAAIGMPRAASEAPNKYLQRVQQQLPEQNAQRFAHITEKYLQLRYGKDPSLQKMIELKNAVNSFKISPKKNS